MKSRAGVTTGTIALAMLLGLIVFWAAGNPARADADREKHSSGGLEPGDSIRTSPEEQRIVEELGRVVKIDTLDVEGVTLRDLLSDLAEQHGIEINFDNLAIDDADLTIDRDVALNLDAVQGKDFREALVLMLEPEGLAFHIWRDALRITARQRLETWIATRAYAIPEIEDAAARKELAEHLAALLLAREASRFARESQEVSADDEPGMPYMAPTIKVFEDRVLIHAPVADHKELQELLRLIYLDL